ncbi:hypothetical protein NUSPORA_02504 [Nucleospora cyclopteri]
MGSLDKKLKNVTQEVGQSANNHTTNNNTNNTTNTTINHTTNNSITTTNSTNTNNNNTNSNNKNNKNNTKYIVIISADNLSFKVQKEIALQSATIKTFLNYSHEKNEIERINLPIESKLLKRCIEFMEYKSRNKDGSTINSNLEGKEEFNVSEEETIELLDVATYLQL